MDSSNIIIRTLVVDDEPLALDLVADYVRQTPFLELVDSCSNAKDAFERIIGGGVDLLLCDIQMPGMSGLTLMKALKAAQTLPKVIFTTAFPEYALDGFRLDAVDYLLKPFDDEEFAKSVGKAKRLFELEQIAASVESKEDAVTDNDIAIDGAAEDLDDDDFFFVRSEYKLIRIRRRKIIYIEGFKDYVCIYIDGEPDHIMTLMSLKELSLKLDENQYVRLHRSYIVNLNYVSGREHNQLFLIDGTILPIGDRYRADFVNVMNRKIL